MKNIIYLTINIFDFNNYFNLVEFNINYYVFIEYIYCKIKIAIMKIK